MSLLLISLLSNKKDANNKSPGLVDSETHSLQQLKRTRTWLLTYIALFTSLLAFFILIISITEMEGSTPKRNYQKLMLKLNKELVYHREQTGVPWLQIENTLSKGIRITLPSDLIESNTLFASARAEINPRYFPYLRSMADIFKALDIPGLKQRHARLISGIETENSELKFMIRIEGHTDSNPLAATAFYKNNVELSTFRAYSMLEWLRAELALPADHFMISGYGSFHPLTANAKEAVNRRIEIYLVPQLISNKPMDTGAAAAVEGAL